MPKNYVSIDSTEMEYIDGGGKITLTLKGSTIAGAAASGVSYCAVKAALMPAITALSVSIFAGTAGWGTLISTALLLAAPKIISVVCGLITAALIDGNVKGKSFTIVDKWYVPNMSFSI
jgi:hypothetical protein